MSQAVSLSAKAGVSDLFPFRTGDRFSMILAQGLFLLLILTTPWSHRAHAASDDYLKAIDAEGNRLEFLGQAKKEQEMLMRDTPQVKDGQKPRAAQKKTVKAAPASVPSSSPDFATSATRTAASRAEFEQALKKNFPGSFALYSLLEPQEKEAVFNEYENVKSEGAIRFLPAVSKIILFNSMANKAR